MSEYTNDQKSQIRNCQLMNMLGFITGAGITIAYYPESYYYYFRIQTDLFYIFRTWLFIAHLTQPLNLQCSASLLSLVYLTILLTRKIEMSRDTCAPSYYRKCCNIRWRFSPICFLLELENPKIFVKKIMNMKTFMRKSWNFLEKSWNVESWPYLIQSWQKLCTRS